MTDTEGMKNPFLTVGRSFQVLPALLALGICMAAAGTLRAAERCRHCGGGAAGMTTPYGDTGCGPRSCKPPTYPDPCDGCNRWRGCNGVREMPDMLTPWQLPPGRGFQTAAQLGYAPGGTCTDCQPWFYNSLCPW